MSDDELSAATRNLSLQDRPAHLQSHRALEADSRGHRHSSIVTNNVRTHHATRTFRSPHAHQIRRRHQSHRSHQTGNPAGRFFRTRAQLMRQVRSQRRQAQALRNLNTQMQAINEEAAGREHNYRVLAVAQRRSSNQLSVVVIIAPGAEHWEQQMEENDLTDGSDW